MRNANFISCCYFGCLFTSAAYATEKTVKYSYIKQIDIEKLKSKRKQY
jgi:hypothetical protein